MKKKIYLSLILSLLVLVASVLSPISAAASGALSVNAKAAILMDADSGTVVFEKAPTERLQIASMVKIMTLNLIFEEIENGNLSYDTLVTASEHATSMGGSQAFLDANCQYKTSELIKSIIVASANDSCVAMAEHISGSVPAFVDKMNEKAAQLGMENTLFVNCTGLPAPNQYSCASDVAKMMKRLISHDSFFDFSKVWTFDFCHPSGRVTELTNTNKLVRFYEGCDGGKTGFTSEALSCLSATAMRGESRFICVVIGAPNSKERNAQVSSLFNYGFANFENKTYFTEGEVICDSIKVENGKASVVAGVASKNLSVFVKKGENNNFVVTNEFYDVKAPVKRGDVIGEVKIVNGEELVGSASILAAESVEKKGFQDILHDIADKW